MICLKFVARCPCCHRCIDICEKLTEKCGFHVTPANVRCALVALHRENCPAKYRGLWDVVCNITVGDVVETVSSFLAEPENQEREDLEYVRCCLDRLQQQRDAGGDQERFWGWISAGVAVVDALFATPENEQQAREAGEQERFWGWIAGGAVALIDAFCSTPENKQQVSQA